MYAFKISNFPESDRKRCPWKFWDAPHLYLPPFPSIPWFVRTTLLRSLTLPFICPSHWTGSMIRICKSFRPWYSVHDEYMTMTQRRRKLGLARMGGGLEGGGGNLTPVKQGRIMLWMQWSLMFTYRSNFNCNSRKYCDKSYINISQFIKNKLRLIGINLRIL